MHVPKQKRTKLDKKSKKLILVGFCDNVKGYRLYDAESKDVIISRDVIIIEKDKKTDFFHSFEVPTNKENPDSVGDSEDEDVASSYNPNRDNLSVDSSIGSENVEEVDNDCDSDFRPDKEYLPEGSSIRRSERERKPKVFDEYVTYLCSSDDALEDTPATVSEALSRSDGRH